ncbi:protease inhibitor I42 family protein [Streptomyces sp. Amel2xC10]|uniref:protease inhibitor I42 family protein n=1 Tax=Streptomyces sp. Amel2xC10 TaxID=1305826 RepID=UPI000A084EBB|nr:protease inhibitor I42 family protein [Streptomyces sp. Amel2xC10]SMF56911.1 inhibitor of cysteine peptidase [Streptomyces sp. Amel2xC10]
MSRSRTRGTAFALLATAVAITGCGSGDDAPTSHPVDDTTVTAGVGERFTLTVTDNASTRSHWYLVDPKPDGAVVRERGRETVSDDDAAPGSGTDVTFTFEATGAGSTEIVLLHCTFSSTCDTGDGTPAPAPTGGATPTEPERVIYKVTVE